MRGYRRASGFIVSAMMVVATLHWAAEAARAVSIPVTFTLSTSAADNKISGVGTAEGVLPGNTSSSKLPLTAQAGGGGVANWQGTINAQVGFDPVSGQVTRIRFTGANINPLDHSSFSPGGWDPDAEDPTGDPGNTDGNFTKGTFEPGDYAYLIPGFVQSAIRGSLLSTTSGNNAVSGGSFKAATGIQFTDGVLALNAEPLDSIANDPLTDQILALELADQNTYGGQHVGLGVWRVGGTVNGALTPRFDAAGDPVILRDQANNPLQQVFQNDASLDGNVALTNLGGQSRKLDLTLPIDADAIFYIGDFEVIFGFSGTLKATATVNLPKPGDTNDDGKVNGVDYIAWANGFNKFNSSANALYTQGEFTGDGKVDGTDYITWATNFQSGSAAMPVPEPSTMALSLLAGLGLGLAAWRSRFKRS